MINVIKYEKKYLDLLFNITKDKKFNYHLQEKINLTENTVFFERINYFHKFKNRM